MARPLNYTTSIKASVTLGEVQSILAEHGADAVAIRYADRRPVGVSFTLNGSHGNRAYNLPVDVEAMHLLLTRAENDGEFKGSRKAKGSFSTVEHAERVAWRVVKDWLEAQLALVAAHMAKVEEVMLPYLVTGSGETLYEVYARHDLREAIEA